MVPTVIGERDILEDFLTFPALPYRVVEIGISRLWFDEEKYMVASFGESLKCIKEFLVCKELS